MIARQLPVGENLGTMSPGPLENEAFRALGQRTSQDHAIDGDRRPAAAVRGMEVGDGVVSLAPIHGYDDPIELADTWHLTNGKPRLGWERSAMCDRLGCRR
jgi:hypothetical protein